MLRETNQVDEFIRNDRGEIVGNRPYPAPFPISEGNAQYKMQQWGNDQNTVVPADQLNLNRNQIKNIMQQQQDAELSQKQELIQKQKERDIRFEIGRQKYLMDEKAAITKKKATPPTLTEILKSYTPNWLK